MRLFVAVRPTHQALAHLRAALPGRRASPPDQWHVTLAFLGDVTRPQVLYDGLREAAAKTPAFDIHLAGSGAFSGARAVWTGIAGDLDALGALAAEVQQGCRDAGVELEHRRFRPHLTVGKAGRVDPALLSGYRGPSWRVADIELVHSVLGKAVTHTVLERFPLYQA